MDRIKLTNMSKQSNKRTSFMLITLLALLLVAYKVMFVAPPEIEEVNPASVVRVESMVSLNSYPASVVRVESMVSQLNSVDFSSSAINDPKFNTLETIEQPLISLPVGRSNPFSGF